MTLYDLIVDYSWRRFKNETSRLFAPFLRRFCRLPKPATVQFYILSVKHTKVYARLESITRIYYLSATSRSIVFLVSYSYMWRQQIVVYLVNPPLANILSARWRRKNINVLRENVKLISHSTLRFSPFFLSLTWRTEKSSCKENSILTFSLFILLIWFVGSVSKSKPRLRYAHPMPTRKGLLAPQNTFLDTIATRFDGTRKFCLPLHASLNTHTRLSFIWIWVEIYLWK